MVNPAFVFLIPLPENVRIELLGVQARTTHLQPVFPVGQEAGGGGLCIVFDFHGAVVFLEVGDEDGVKRIAFFPLFQLFQRAAGIVNQQEEILFGNL